MATFYKRNTLIRNISLMAIMAAINVIFSVLNNFVPLISAFLIIFLPLTSAIVEINCKDRYFPIYAFATIGLSIVVSLQSIDFTLFYVVPSIITGYLFGLSQKRKFAPVISIFVASLLQTILSFAFIPLMELISERNLLDDINKIFSFPSTEAFQKTIPLLFFVVAVIQTLLSYFVVSNELKRMGMEIEHKKEYLNVAYIAIFASLILCVIFALTLPQFCLICAGFAWFFEIYIVVLGFKNKSKLYLVTFGVTSLLNLFYSAGLNSFIGEDFFPLTFFIAPVLTSIVLIFVYFLNNKRTANKI